MMKFCIPAQRLLDTNLRTQSKTLSAGLQPDNPPYRTKEGDAGLADYLDAIKAGAKIIPIKGVVGAE